MIRQATRKDIEQITHIAQENKLTPTKKQDSFLVSNYQEDDYRHFIDTLKHFYVLVAFLLVLILIWFNIIIIGLTLL